MVWANVRLWPKAKNLLVFGMSDKPHWLFRAAAQPGGDKSPRHKGFVCWLIGGLVLKTR
jgi:hypothetical protein